MKESKIISSKKHPKTTALKQYIAIDLKSFYASVECVMRGYDPLSTNLVVADKSRTDKTICLAVTPSLKAYGISGRARLFEVVQKVKEINQERFHNMARTKQAAIDPDTGQPSFSGESIFAPELDADPSLKLAYCVAPPRMRLYEEYSTKIFSIYLKYISHEDIVVYSIDECFIDATPYLATYGMNAHELAMTMIRDVLSQTGITATAGIGTNLYLCKVAMDIVAKHTRADQDGVRIAELDEMSYRKKLWCHTPLTDFWRVGSGITRRLAKLGIYTMGDIARTSVNDEDSLYKAFGVNAELLIDHAWGWEPTDISTIKSYKPQTNSISSGQVLQEPYDADKGKLIVREMTELLALDLVKKGLVTRKLVLTIGYDRDSLVAVYKGRNIAETTYNVRKTGKRYRGIVKSDHYGRAVPKHAHGTGNIDRWTSSSRRIVDTMMKLYDDIIDWDLLIRRVNVVAANLIPETDIPPSSPEQMDFFTDYEALEKKRKLEDIADQKERRLQKATLKLQEKFGKNAVLKGMNLSEGATTIARNQQIGGHSAGEQGH